MQSEVVVQRDWVNAGVHPACRQQSLQAGGATPDSSAWRRAAVSRLMQKHPLFGTSIESGLSDSAVDMKGPHPRPGPESVGLDQEGGAFVLPL